MNCSICLVNKGEGNVCHECRLKFKELAVSEYEFYHTIECMDCDDGFPCISCAKYTFDNKIGQQTENINETELDKTDNIEPKSIEPKIIKSSQKDLGVSLASYLLINFDRKLTIQCSKCNLFTVILGFTDEDLTLPCNRCGGVKRYYLI